MNRTNRHVDNAELTGMTESATSNEDDLQLICVVVQVCRAIPSLDTDGHSHAS